MNATTTDRLLTVPEVAERLNTAEGFVRRIIDERRIEFIRVGRYVRISELTLAEFIAAGTVEPALRRHRSRRMRG